MNSKGFSLIELLVVVMVIIILSLAASIGYTSYYSHTSYKLGLAFDARVNRSLFTSRVAEWLFDKKSGASFLDTSGNNYTAVPHGNGNVTQSATGCVSGACAYFVSGSSLRVADPAAGANRSDADSRYKANYKLDLAGDFTITGWVKLTNLSITSGALVEKQKELSGDQGWPWNYALYWGGPANVRYFSDSFGGGTDWMDTNVSIADGRWHHIAATRKALGSGNFKVVVYVDGTRKGELVQSPNGRPGMLMNDGPLFIGSSAPLNAFDNFEGYIDDVRIYSATIL